MEKMPLTVTVQVFNASTNEKKYFSMSIDHNIDVHKAMEQGWTHISTFVPRDKVSIGLALETKGWVNGGVARSGDTRYWLPMTKQELEVVPF